MPVSLSQVQAFYQAYARRDVAAVLDFVTDDVEWRVLGPVEVLPFCGHRRGKAAVAEYFTLLIPTRFSVRRLEPEDMVVDGDSAASFSKVTSVENVTGRVLTYHCAHFVDFRDGKVISIRVIADSFSVVEQLSSVQIRMDLPSGIPEDCGWVPA
jgi:ketosteroid isomerase-like protein